MINRVVGNCKIVEKIGEGGMGTVLRGIDLMLEREVAIKVLHPELARQPQVVERFRSEAVTLAKLSHPNIATLYSFLRQGDEYFMVMEFVRGKTLAHVLMESCAVPWRQAVALHMQVLEGVSHAHKLGVVHRDIKPANIMCTDSGLVKVMDFGIARVLGTARMTRAGHLVGTVEYMPPEQVRGQEGDERSDLYSAGIVLYEMITGRVPFSGDSDYELMRAQIEKLPEPPHTFTTDLPPELERLTLRALEKDPARRFQTADEFRAALIEVFSTAGLEAAGQGASAGSRQAATASQMPTYVLRESAFKETRVAGMSAPQVASAAAGATRLAEDVTDGSGQPVAPEAAQAAPVSPPLLSRLTWKQYSVAGALLITLVGTVWLLTGGSSSKPNPGIQPAPAADVDASHPPPSQSPVQSRPVQPPANRGPIDPERLPGVIPQQAGRGPRMSPVSPKPREHEPRQPSARAPDNVAADNVPAPAPSAAAKEPPAPDREVKDKPPEEGSRKPAGQLEKKKSEPDPRDLLRRYLKKKKPPQ